MRTRSAKKKKEERNSLRKLSRLEILELFLKQSEELEKTKEELRLAKLELEERKIVIAESGSIAEAALKLSGIFEVAQKAADDYLHNLNVPQSVTSEVTSGDGENFDDELSLTTENYEDEDQKNY